MTSTAHLSADLLSGLLTFTTPFNVTSSRFLARLSTEESLFPRVCELHNTLELLASSSSPMRRLYELRGVKGDGETNQDAEDLLSFMLNAEFLLYSLYKEYSILLNPSLAHWVGCCREFERYAKGHVGEWGLRDQVLKMRAAFVKGILSERGEDLAKITPQDFALRGLDFDVELDSFREALLDQGIYEEDYYSDGPEVGDSPQAYTESQNDSRYSKTPSVCTETTRTPATPSTPSHQQDAQAQAQIANILVQAMSEELTPILTDRLLTHISANLSILTTIPLELLLAPAFSNLFSTNPTLTRGLVSLFLSSGNKSQRRELLGSLELLPITLGSLEMLNDLTQTQLLSNGEIVHLVHGVLANGVRTAETMGARQAQNRLVKLLCLFVQSVLRSEVVVVTDVYYHVQDLGVKFMSVKEARELWRMYCAT